MDLEVVPTMLAMLMVFALFLSFVVGMVVGWILPIDMESRLSRSGSDDDHGGGTGHRDGGRQKPRGE